MAVGTYETDDGRTTETGDPQAGQAGGGDPRRATVQGYYQQFLGRDATDQEIDGWLRSHPDMQGLEEAIATSSEAQLYRAKGGGSNPTTTPPAGSTTTGYDLNKLKAGILALGGHADAATLAAYIKAHPEFATGVTIGGSKNNKLYYNGQYLAKVISATSSDNPTWAWDTSTGDSGGSTGVDESYLTGYPGGAFQATDDTNVSDFAGIGDFQQPTAEDLYKDPSYQFRRDESLAGVENSAAGRGLLNSGGTLYDLLGTASQFASTEYGNVWDRAMKSWDEKYNQAYSTYNTNRTTKENKYGREWDAYKWDVKNYQDERDSAWDKLYKTSALGAGVTTAD